MKEEVITLQNYIKTSSEDIQWSDSNDDVGCEGHVTKGMDEPEVIGCGPKRRATTRRTR